MKNIILALIFTILSSQISLGQIPTGLLTEQEAKVLKEFSEGYYELVCFDNYKFLAKLFDCLSNKISTTDGECLVFVPVSKKFSGIEVDSILIKNHYENWNDRIDNFHIDQIKSYLKTVYGDYTSDNWKDFVTYYSNREAKNIFNADSAITFNIKLRKEDYYLGKYTNVKFLFIQKKGRFYNMIISFYTDLAMRRINEYNKLVESIYRYEN